MFLWSRFRNSKDDMSNLPTATNPEMRTPCPYIFLFRPLERSYEKKSDTVAA
jgi:hypothetical protein